MNAVAEPDDLQPSDQPKLDPATLELRGRPPRPVRFRRGVVIGGAGIAAAALAGAIGISLRSGRAPAARGDAVQAARAPVDFIRGLPADYGAVPKLGPPLPGDLGRPILERQRELSAARPGDAAHVSAAEARGQRLEALKAARQSGLLVRAPDGGGGTAAMAMPVQGSSPTAASALPASIDLERDPNAQTQKRAFADATEDQGDINPHRLTAPASPYLLSAGSVIPASLITGLRSDLPGLVAAQVSENVYDTATGQILLVPQGARLIGRYDSVVAFGQQRALVVWQRIVMPDGRAVRLDNEPATDPSGYAGVADRVDFHTWALLRGVAMSTLLGAGTSVSLTGESDLVQAIRESAQQNAANAGNQITARNLQVQPTITVRPGSRIRLLVHHDLILAPWRNQE